jgi:hypothetical protein
MNKRTLAPLLALLPLLAQAQSIERQVIGSVGTTTTVGNLMHTHTVGEMSTTLLADGELILTQGFHQGTNLTVHLVEPAVGLHVHAYPNPTMDRVFLDLVLDRDLALFITVFDMAGKRLSESREEVTTTGLTRREVDLSTYAPGAYFIRLTDRSGQLGRTIKVEKMH